MSEPILGDDRPDVLPLPQQGRGNGQGIVVVAALAILAGVLIGGSALVFPGGGDRSTTATAPMTLATPATTTPNPGPTAMPRTERAHISSRDPFADLGSTARATSAAGDTPPAPAGPSVSKAAADPAVAAAGEAVVSASPTPTPTPVAETTRPASGDKLSVLSISARGDSVKLRLNSRKYTVAAGETFAKDYKLYDIFDAECAGFLHGDTNTVLCVGDTATM